ncbi:MAG: DUF2490 domain-containing protein [Bacteroidetes bacterium]|nr:DUF2490 domain-containing protein [Bacteroidota bacterium]
MKNIKKSISIVIFVGAILSTFAQETVVTSDLEQWTSLSISKKINKHWKLSLDQEFRLNHNASEFNIYFTDLGVDYKINKYFSLGANYRFYQNKNNDNVFVTQHRWSTDLKYKQDIGRFEFGYRLRFQNKDEDFYTSDTGNNLYNLRNKFSAEYNIRNCKIDPFFSTELYRTINSTTDTELSKLRWTLGLEYSIKKIGDIELYYRMDNELNLSYDKTTHIIGVGYKYSF